jgi:hypothetical protein
VHAAVSDNVVQTDDRSVNNPLRVKLIPCHRSSDGGVASRIDGPVDWLCLVLNKEHIVLILVRVEGDLLLLATSGVHVLMGVKVTALSVVVAKADTCAKSDISRDISHTLSVESRLELAAHESITITRVDEADKVDSEHGHVESNRNDDQAESTGKKVLEPDSSGDVLRVSEQNPKLKSGQGSNPCDREEADPLDAEGSSKSNTRCSQPEPPGRLESIFRAKLMLVLEGSPGKSGHASEQDQR